MKTVFQNVLVLPKRFWKAERGSIAVHFALASIPIVLSVGAAVDYSLGNRVKTKLDALADSAALAAVSQSEMLASSSQAQSAAISLFNAQSVTVKPLTSVLAKATVTDGSNGRTAIVNYTATIPTYFMGLAGINNLTITGKATAASATPTYMDFYLLLDNTPSMALGATTADINTMVNQTSDQCAFACHQLDISPNDYYGLAKKLGVSMRIDVVRAATQALMDSATATQSASNQFRMAIYTFGTSAQKKGLKTIQSRTSNLSTAKTSASNIDVMTVPYDNYGGETDTNFDDVLGDMNSAIPAGGNGSASQPQKILFFVSDGVASGDNMACTQQTFLSRDPQTGVNYVRCIEPLNVASCTAIKNRGIKIAVLYTTYLPLPTNSFYNKYVAPFADQISVNMQRCASPGLFFEVNTSQSIPNAMTALFSTTVQQGQPRLTN